MGGGEGAHRKCPPTFLLKKREKQLGRAVVRLSTIYCYFLLKTSGPRGSEADNVHMRTPGSDPRCLRQLCIQWSLVAPLNVLIPLNVKTPLNVKNNLR